MASPLDILVEGSNGASDYGNPNPSLTSTHPALPTCLC